MTRGINDWRLAWRGISVTHLDLCEGYDTYTYAHTYIHVHLHLHLHLHLHARTHADSQKYKDKHTCELNDVPSFGISAKYTFSREIYSTVNTCPKILSTLYDSHADPIAFPVLCETHAFSLQQDRRTWRPPVMTKAAADKRRAAPAWRRGEAPGRTRLRPPVRRSVGRGRAPLCLRTSPRSSPNVG